VVAPGADPGQIRLAVRGAEDLRIDEAGNLVLAVSGGELVQKAPHVYQEIDGTRQLVTGGYRLLPPANSDDSGLEPQSAQLAFAREAPVLIGVQVAAYDPSQPLIVDPVVVYSTYLGGHFTDLGFGIALDGAGNAYVMGATQGGYPTSPNDFPPKGPIFADLTIGYSNVSVSKFNANGSALIYSTIVGGSASDDVNFDHGNSIAVDAFGNAYVTGGTRSTDFPTTDNALYPVFGGGQGGLDAFFFKLIPDGSAFVYSTYLGGSYNDWGNSIAADTAGNAYVTGQTSSLDFPVVNELYPWPGHQDGFVFKLNADGSEAVYSTFLHEATFGTTIGYGIAADAAGNAYVTGYASGGLPTTDNAPQPDPAGSYEAFIAKLNSDASALVYGTYLGGSTLNYGYGIAVDDVGNAYVTGQTYSSDFPTVNAAYPQIGGVSGEMQSSPSSTLPARPLFTPPTWAGLAWTKLGELPRTAPETRM
jgi:hypothetical protein